MAVVRSLWLRKARKSLAGTNYKQIYGRTIQSENPGQRGSALDKYNSIKNSASSRAEDVDTARESAIREAQFGFVSRYARMHADDINVSFDKAKYGTRRNYFMHVNGANLLLAVRMLAVEMFEAPFGASDDEIEAAVTTYAIANPVALFRVKLTGYPVQYLTGAWDSNDNPQPVEPASVSSVLLGGTAVISGNDYPLSAASTLAVAGSGITSSNVRLRLNGSSLTPKSVTSSEIQFNIAVNGSYQLVVNGSVDRSFTVSGLPQAATVTGMTRDGVAVTIPYSFTRDSSGLGATHEMVVTGTNLDSSTIVAPSGAVRNAAGSGTSVTFTLDDSGSAGEVSIGGVVIINILSADGDDDNTGL